jgi:hypothetical protein
MKLAKIAGRLVGREAVAIVLRPEARSVLGFLADRLIASLGGKSDKVRLRAAASPIELGGRILPTLRDGCSATATRPCRSSSSACWPRSTAVYRRAGISRSCRTSSCSQLNATEAPRVAGRFLPRRAAHPVVRTAIRGPGACPRHWAARGSSMKLLSLAEW